MRPSCAHDGNQPQLEQSRHLAVLGIDPHPEPRGNQPMASQGQTYQGKPVQSVRDARQGDPGFQQGQDQVVVTLPDGTEKVVSRNEIKDQSSGQQR
jgi:hypothetical protein